MSEVDASFIATMCVCLPQRLTERRINGLTNMSRTVPIYWFFEAIFWVL